MNKSALITMKATKAFSRIYCQAGPANESKHFCPLCVPLTVYSGVGYFCGYGDCGVNFPINCNRCLPCGEADGVRMKPFAATAYRHANFITQSLSLPNCNHSLPFYPICLKRKQHIFHLADLKSLRQTH